MEVKLEPIDDGPVEINEPLPDDDDVKTEQNEALPMELEYEPDQDYPIGQIPEADVKIEPEDDYPNYEDYAADWENAEVKEEPDF